MISLTTAKLLLIVALLLGPKYGDNNHVIQITDKNSTHDAVWTENSGGWTLTEKPFPTHDWPANGVAYTTQELNTYDAENKAVLRAIQHHNWKQDGVLDLDNGDRVEKQGNQIFYTSRAGSANEAVYTILTIENGKSL